MTILAKKYDRNRAAGHTWRDKAARWAKLYRDAQAAGGRLLLNPDDPPEDHIWFDGTNPETLISLLEDFSRTGKLGIDFDFRPLQAKLAAGSVTEKFPRAKNEAVMKAFNVGDRQARRLRAKSKVAL